MCRQGASVIQSAVLDTISDPSLRAFVAWVPILPDDTGPPDEETRSLIADRRAAHFWDERRTLPDMFNPVLRLPEGWPAWDVYLAYEDKGATWSEVMRLAAPRHLFLPWILGVLISHLFHARDELEPVWEADSAYTLMWIFSIAFLLIGVFDVAEHLKTIHPQAAIWAMGITALLGMLAGYLFWPKKRKQEWRW